MRIPEEGSRTLLAKRGATGRSSQCMTCCSSQPLRRFSRSGLVKPPRALSGDMLTCLGWFWRSQSAKGFTVITRRGRNRLVSWPDYFHYFYLPQDSATSPSPCLMASGRRASATWCASWPTQITAIWRRQSSHPANQSALL